MNIYLITQHVHNDYDTYDSAVVYAASEEEARNIHPSGRNECWVKEQDSSYWIGSWCRPEDVVVLLLSTNVLATHEEQIKQIICASYNAG